MWTARIFAGIAFSGIIFLLGFLIQLLREQPFRSHRIRSVRPADYAAMNPLQSAKRMGCGQARGREGYASLHLAEWCEPHNRG